MPDPSPEQLEAIAVAAADAAAQLIRAETGRARLLGVKTTPTDIVTQLDLDAEAAVRAVLTGRTPDAGVLGEEGGSSEPGAAVQWIVDPLDGTVNYFYGVPLCAVSVAAAVRGQVVAGAVVDVWRAELFAAHVGGGARLDSTAISTSTCSEAGSALVLTGFAYDADSRARQGETMQRLLPQVRDVRCFGSTAIELAWVACGRADAYYQRDVQIWDYAAGALIAAEAGALVELPCPENGELVLASAPGVFEALCEATE